MKTILYNHTLSWFSPSFEIDWEEPIIPCRNVIQEESYQTPLAYNFRYSVPGYKKRDLQISVLGDTLKIQGFLKNKGRHWNLLDHQLRESQFIKNIRLYNDMNIDKISAQLKNGILNIDIPKKEEYVSYREIPIDNTSDVVEIISSPKNKIQNIIRKLKQKISKLF